jgi:hypothetical protein
MGVHVTTSLLYNRVQSRTLGVSASDVLPFDSLGVTHPDTG